MLLFLFAQWQLLFSLDSAIDSFKLENNMVQISAGQFTGSGFVFKTENRIAYIATSYHVIYDDGYPVYETDVRVSHPKYKELFGDVTFFRSDPNRDIVVFKVDFDPAKAHFVDIPFSDGEPPESGEAITLAFPSNEKNLFKFYGNLQGVFASSTYFGSNRKCEYNDGYNIARFDRKITAGSSGGLLISRKTGQAIGIATGTLGPSESYASFAVPIEYLWQLMASKGDALVNPCNNDAYYSQENLKSMLYPSSIRRSRVPIEVRPGGICNIVAEISCFEAIEDRESSRKQVFFAEVPVDCDGILYLPYRPTKESDSYSIVLSHHCLPSSIHNGITLPDQPGKQKPLDFLTSMHYSKRAILEIRERRSGQEVFEVYLDNTKQIDVKLNHEGDNLYGLKINRYFGSNEADWLFVDPPLNAFIPFEEGVQDSILPFMFRNRSSGFEQIDLYSQRFSFQLKNIREDNVEATRHLTVWPFAESGNKPIIVKIMFQMVSGSETRVLGSEIEVNPGFDVSYVKRGDRILFVYDLKDKGIPIEYDFKSSLYELADGKSSFHSVVAEGKVEIIDLQYRQCGGK